MRRVVVAILLIMLAAPAFADDAKVLPAGVLRTTIAPAFVTAGSAFGTDFETDRSSIDDIAFFNLGVALEYGATDWITAAVQWAPGWNVWSDIDGTDGEFHPFFDVFAGAKVQIIGENAPVQRSDMRFAFAPGVKIPLGYPDWEDEDPNDPDIVAVAQPKPDGNAFGVGARVYYDYIINENWFINLFSEAGLYLLDSEAATLSDYSVAEALPGYDSDEFDYGWDIEFEIEAHYEKMVGEGLQFGASLPINIDYLPETRLGGDKLSDIDTSVLAPAGLDGVWDDEGPSSLLSVGPSVKLFAQSWPVPTEFIAQYTAPVAGRRANASHVFSLQIRNYLSF